MSFIQPHSPCPEQECVLPDTYAATEPYGQDEIPEMDFASCLPHRIQVVHVKLEAGTSPIHAKNTHVVRTV